MIFLEELVTHTNALLEIDKFKDYCPNGLQVEGKHKIEKIAVGVSASLECIEKAIAAKADALIVHHGLFWRGDSPCVVSMQRRRLAKLLQADLSLLAYHLPLDMHITLGNNFQLAKMLGIDIDGTFRVEDGLEYGFKGALEKETSATQFAKFLEKTLKHKPLHIAGTEKTIRTIGWCTGAAQDYLEYAHAARLDAYITGEVSERTYHIAKELDIHFYAAGHYATECYGVQALGEHLQREYDLGYEFIDVGNPV